ncbi:MAG: flagellar basal body P-ring formation protein FlgA [Rhodospirillaceae bacterium]|nr:flagellar basal body P-ring formation protein FlgA [Rhodospirillaceae bacterium]
MSRLHRYRPLPRRAGLLLGAWLGCGVAALGVRVPALAEELAAAPADIYVFGGEEMPQLNLRSSIMVDDDVIRLGDLFMETLSIGDTPIAQAPAPGGTLALDARFLRQLARAYRLDWQPESKFERVLVGRMSHRIDSATVLAALDDSLRARSGNGAGLEIVLDGGDAEFVLPTNLAPTVGVLNLQYDPASQRFGALLVVPATGPTAQQRYVTGWAHETIDIPVLNRAVPAGTTIRDSDLEWTSIRADRLIGNVVTDPRQLLGMTTKRPLRSNQILRNSDLALTPAVRKNSLVTLALQSGQMSLSVAGKVLEDAALGQSVRVMNVTSKKELVGIVRDPATVEIPLVGHLTLN